MFRSGMIDFENVPVDASSKIDDNLTQSIEPYDTKEYEDFNTNYLAGYLADKYDVEAEECKNTADERIVNQTNSMFASTLAGYSSVMPVRSKVGIASGKQEYNMLPMYILNINYKNQNYVFAMNGQTGKFVGNLPSDKGKLIRIGLLVFLGVSIVLTAIQYLMFRFA